MKYKWLALFLLGVMVVSSLTPPAVATAKATDLRATLFFTGIDPTVLGTNVFPIPNPKAGSPSDAVRWLIRGRHLTGILPPMGHGMRQDIVGTLSLDMDGNLDPTQTGSLHGTFTIDTGTYETIYNPPPFPPTFTGDGNDLITGTIEIKLVALQPTPVFDQSGNLINLIAPVTASGHMVMKQGTGSMTGFQAQAAFGGTIMTALLDPAGHVVGFLPSPPVQIQGTQR